MWSFSTSIYSRKKKKMLRSCARGEVGAERGEGGNAATVRGNGRFHDAARRSMVEKKKKSHPALPKPNTSGGYAACTCWLSEWEFHCVSTKMRVIRELMQFARGKSIKRYVAPKRRAARDWNRVNGFPSSGPPASTRACTSSIDTGARCGLAFARGSATTVWAMLERSSSSFFPAFSDSAVVEVVATGEGSLMADTDTEERADGSCFVAECGRKREKIGE